MIITHVTEADLPSLLELEGLGFETARQWTAAAWSEELKAPDRFVLARLDRDGRLIGVAAFSCVADLADLNRVIVHPEARGRGVGSSLIRAGMDWAAAVGGKRMLLEVGADNEAALAMYRSLGFEWAGTRSDYYGPGLDAHVMLRGLGAEDAWAVGCA